MQNSPSQVVELGNLWKKKHAVKHGNWVKPSVKLDHSVKSGHNRTARATPNSFILGETRSNAVDRGDGKIDSHMSITTTNPPPPGTAGRVDDDDAGDDDARPQQLGRSRRFS